MNGNETITPLMKAANRYLQGGFSRFHMPGHKGAPLAGLGDMARYDLTEVTGMDSLYEASGAIAATEAAYTRLYGAKASLLGAGGSTLCIQAMLSLAVPAGGKVLAARGVHTAVVNAMALLDLHPAWIYPRQDPATGLALPVTPKQVEQGLLAHPDASAVYLTSPTYFGAISDIRGIKAVCRRFAVPLLVDNAHGAHLKFCRPSLHPMDLGADLCCDSLHKTLPVLTGGALLHIGDKRFLSHAKARMALFGSTSPSYLIMLSADAALPYIEQELAADIDEVTRRLAPLADLARSKGFLLPTGLLEPMRLTLGFGGVGYTDAQFLEHLHSYRIEPEYLSGSYCVLMATGQNVQQDFSRLESAIASVQPRPPLPLPEAFPHPTGCAMTLREACFSDIEEIPIERAVGRIAGSTVAPCPPGIPLVLAGEVVDTACIDALKNCGIRCLNVIK